MNTYTCNKVQLNVKTTISNCIAKGTAKIFSRCCAYLQQIRRTEQGKILNVIISTFFLTPSHLEISRFFLHSRVIHNDYRLTLRFFGAHPQRERSSYSTYRPDYLSYLSPRHYDRKVNVRNDICKQLHKLLRFLNESTEQTVTCLLTPEKHPLTRPPRTYCKRVRRSLRTCNRAPLFRP